MQQTTRKQYTKGQMELEKIINDLGMQTVLEYHVGDYIIDIFLPETNQGVEFDGPVHNKKHDARRDAWLLENYNIKIYRVSDLRDGGLKQNLINFISG
jgi:very-short-patch-repair endonuclease